MTIYLYKTSTPSTRNAAIDVSQVKLNTQINLIYGQTSLKNKYGKIITMEHYPNRNAYFCLVHYRDGEKRYILHPRRAIIIDTIISGIKVPIKMRNALPLSAV
ncbi:hypothetical protein Peur_030545 [Populus x canadensis]